MYVLCIVWHTFGWSHENITMHVHVQVNAREKSVQYELRIQQLTHVSVFCNRWHAVVFLCRAWCCVQDLSESSTALEKARAFRATSDLVIAELKKQLGQLKFDAFKVTMHKCVITPHCHAAHKLHVAVLIG